MAMVADGVGVWIEQSDGSLREKRRASSRELSREASISLLNVTDLRRLLYCAGHAGVSRLPRAALSSLAMGLPAKDLANAARDAVKRRHRNRHKAFLKARERRGTLEAMTALRRTTPTVKEAGRPIKKAAPLL